MSIIEKIVERIKDQANSPIETHDPDFDDYTFGGNFDDAYSAGIDDGYVMFAKELLQMLEEEDD